MMVMKRFFDKQPIWFAVVWIAVYVLAFSNADSLSETLGIPKLLTCIVGAVLTAVQHHDGVQPTDKTCRFPRRI